MTKTVWCKKGHDFKFPSADARQLVVMGACPLCQSEPRVQRGMICRKCLGLISSGRSKCNTCTRCDREENLVSDEPIRQGYIIKFAPKAGRGGIWRSGDSKTNKVYITEKAAKEAARRQVEKSDPGVSIVVMKIIACYKSVPSVVDIEILPEEAEVCTCDEATAICENCDKGGTA